MLPSGESQKHEFQAETRQLLDIVARTLYSEKEVLVLTDYDEYGYTAIFQNLQINKYLGKDKNVCTCNL